MLFVNNDQIIKKLQEYDPLLRKLSKNPLGKVKSDYELKLSWAEIEDLYLDYQLFFIELAKDFDEHYGVDFHGYIVYQMRWKAYNHAKKIHITEKIPTSETQLENLKELAAEMEEEKEEMYLHLDKLPKRQREVIQLYYFENKKVKDISLMLGIKPQTVLRHRKLALQTLKKHLE